MFGMGRIIGLPLKIFSNWNVYIPFEYLRYYGISEKHDMLALEMSEHSLFYRPIHEEETLAVIKAKPIRAGLMQLPMAWMRQNNLSIGDHVFLLGTANGLLLYSSNTAK